MESRHCGQDKGIFFCPVHNASTPCSLQGFGIGVWFSLYGADLLQQNNLDGIHFVCSLVELKYDTSKLFSRRLDSDS